MDKLYGFQVQMFIHIHVTYFVSRLLCETSVHEQPQSLSIDVTVLQMPLFSEYWSRWLSLTINCLRCSLFIPTKYKASHDTYPFDLFLIVCQSMSHFGNKHSLQTNNWLPIFFFSFFKCQYSVIKEFTKYITIWRTQFTVHILETNLIFIGYKIIWFHIFFKCQYCVGDELLLFNLYGLIIEIKDHFVI